MIEIFIILIGLIFGSFANVCIHRLPLDLDIVKARSLKKKISKQYFIVELLTGLAFIFFYKTLGLSFDFVLICIIFLILLIIFFIDLKHYIIPDSLNFSLILIFLNKRANT